MIIFSNRNAILELSINLIKVIDADLIGLFSIKAYKIFV